MNPQRREFREVGVEFTDAQNEAFKKIRGLSDQMHILAKEAGLIISVRIAGDSVARLSEVISDGAPKPEVEE